MGNSGPAPDGGYRFFDHQRYLDACGGAAVSSMGDAHRDVLAAMHQQIARFGEHGTIDLIAINGYCTLLAMVMNAARTPPPAGPPQPSPPRSPASGGAS